MKQPTSTRFRVIVIILTAAMIAFALIHSAMPAEISAQESAGVLELLAQFLKSVGLESALTDHIVRKLAHFAEYTAIGVLLTSCAYSFDRLRPFRYTTTVLFAGLATAVTDETIQLFSEGRSGQITDVLLDFSGVLLGFAAALAFYIIYIKLKTRGKKHE